MLGVALSVLEQRQQRHGEVELALDVEIEDLVPALLLWEVDHWCSPGEARVVDEDVEPRLGLLDLLGERITAGLGTDVGLESDAEALLAFRVAGGELAELGGDLLKVAELSAGNVDLGAVANIGGSNHLANARATTGDQRHLAVEREEAVGAKLGHDFGCCVLGHRGLSLFGG